MSDQFIKSICKKCRYYKKGCFYDYGDSLTKIPCEALIVLTKIKFILEGINVE